MPDDAFTAPRCGRVADLKSKLAYFLLCQRQIRLFRVVSGVRKDVATVVCPQG